MDCDCLFLFCFLLVFFDLFVFDGLGFPGEYSTCIVCYMNEKLFVVSLRCGCV